MRRAMVLLFLTLLLLCSCHESMTETAPGSCWLRDGVVSKLSQRCSESDLNGKRGMLLSLLVHCGGDGDTRAQQLRVLVKDSAMYGDAVRHAELFAVGSGLNVTCYAQNSLPAAPTTAPAIAGDTLPPLPSSGEVTAAGAGQGAMYTVWLGAAEALGDAAETGPLLNLDSLVDLDSSLDWPGVRMNLAMAATYGGRILALPQRASPLLLLYRRDLVDRLGGRVPATWEELLRAARALNGTDFDGDGQPEVGLCARWYAGCPGAIAPFAHAFLAPYLQTSTLVRGIYFDIGARPTTNTSSSDDTSRFTATLEPLWDTTAVAEALDLLVQLRRVSFDPTTASQASSQEGAGDVRSEAEPGAEQAAVCRDPVTRPFLQGRCAFSLSTFSDFKAASHASSAPNAVRGRLGATLLPGTTRVLLRPADLRDAVSYWAARQQEPRQRQCVNCTWALCPMAEETTQDEFGVVRPVNRAPYIPVDVIAVNRQSSDAALDSLLGYYLASQLAAPADRVDALLNPSTTTSPTRLSDFNPALWIAAGYDPEDSAAVLSAYKATLEHPNAVHALRMKGQAAYGRLFSSLLSSIIAEDGRNLTGILAVANAALAAVFNATEDPGLESSYQRSLDQSQAQDVQPGARTPPPSPISGGTGQGDSGGRDGLPAWGISLVTAVGFVLLALAAAILLRRCRTIPFQRHKARTAPGPGPDTTLLLSDISDSTMLWEVLPADIMDHSVRLHSMAMRHLLVRHHGYESATEGDAFIMAFDNPQAALAFACDLQVVLLKLDWPEELLARPEAAPAYVVPAVSLGRGSSRRRSRADNSRWSRDSPRPHPEHWVSPAGRWPSSTRLTNPLAAPRTLQDGDGDSHGHGLGNNNDRRGGGDGDADRGDDGIEYGDVMPYMLNHCLGTAMAVLGSTTDGRALSSGMPEMTSQLTHWKSGALGTAESAVATVKVEAASTPAARQTRRLAPVGNKSRGSDTGRPCGIRFSSSMPIINVPITDEATAVAVATAAVPPTPPVVMQEWGQAAAVATAAGGSVVDAQPAHLSPLLPLAPSPLLPPTLGAVAAPAAAAGSAALCRGSGRQRAWGSAIAEPAGVFAEAGGAASGAELGCRTAGGADGGGGGGGAGGVGGGGGIAITSSGHDSESDIDAGQLPYMRQQLLLLQHPRRQQGLWHHDRSSPFSFVRRSVAEHTVRRFPSSHQPQFTSGMPLSVEGLKLQSQAAPYRPAPGPFQLHGNGVGESSRGRCWVHEPRGRVGGAPPTLLRATADAFSAAADDSRGDGSGGGGSVTVEGHHAMYDAAVPSPAQRRVTSLDLFASTPVAAASVYGTSVGLSTVGPVASSGSPCPHTRQAASGDIPVRQTVPRTALQLLCDRFTALEGSELVQSTAAPALAQPAVLQPSRLVPPHDVAPIIAGGDPVSAAAASIGFSAGSSERPRLTSLATAHPRVMVPETQLPYSISGDPMISQLYPGALLPPATGCRSRSVSVRRGVGAAAQRSSEFLRRLYGKSLDAWTSSETTPGSSPAPDDALDGYNTLTGADGAGFVSQSVSVRRGAYSHSRSRSRSRSKLVVTDNTVSYVSYMKQLWHVADSNQPDALLIYRGLRLRLGFHTGLASDSDLQINRATGRAAYSGLFMAVAREVSNAGPGGCVMMSEAARRRLLARGAFRTTSPLGCIYLGHYAGTSYISEALSSCAMPYNDPGATVSSFTKELSTAANATNIYINKYSNNYSSLNGSFSTPAVDDSGTTFGSGAVNSALADPPELLRGPGPGLALYQLTGGPAELFTARLVLQPPLSRCGPCRLLGSLAAPLRSSSLAVAEVQVQGIGAILAWNYELGREALQLCLSAMKRLATLHNVAPGDGSASAGDGGGGGGGGGGGACGSKIYISSEDGHVAVDAGGKEGSTCIACGDGVCGVGGYGCGRGKKGSVAAAAAASGGGGGGGGFLETGRVLAVCDEAANLVAWAADLQAAMIRLPWREELLQHEYCAEVSVCRTQIAESTAPVGRQDGPLAQAAGLPPPPPPSTPFLLSPSQARGAAGLLPGAKTRLGLRSPSARFRSAAMNLSKRAQDKMTSATASVSASASAAAPMATFAALAGSLATSGAGRMGWLPSGGEVSCKSTFNSVSPRISLELYSSCGGGTGIGTGASVAASAAAAAAAGSNQSLPIRIPCPPTIRSKKQYADDEEAFMIAAAPPPPLPPPPATERAVRDEHRAHRPATTEAVAGIETGTEAEGWPSGMLRVSSWVSSTGGGGGSSHIDDGGGNSRRGCGRSSSEDLPTRESPQRGWAGPSPSDARLMPYTGATAAADPENVGSGTEREGLQVAALGKLLAPSPQATSDAASGMTVVTAPSTARHPALRARAEAVRAGGGAGFCGVRVSQGGQAQHPPSQKSNVVEMAEVSSTASEAGAATGGVEAQPELVESAPPPPPQPASLLSHSPETWIASCHGAGSFAAARSGASPARRCVSGRLDNVVEASVVARNRVLATVLASGRLADADAAADAAARLNGTTADAAATSVPLPPPPPQTAAAATSRRDSATPRCRSRQGLQSTAWTRQMAATGAGPDGDSGGGASGGGGRYGTSWFGLDSGGGVRHGVSGQAAAAAVGTTAAAAAGLSSQLVVLLRGLRLRIGMDVGGVQGALSKTTGRITYRGRPAYEASRMAGLARAGQVLCGRELVEALGGVGSAAAVAAVAGPGVQTAATASIAAAAPVDSSPAATAVQSLGGVEARASATGTAPGAHFVALQSYGQDPTIEPHSSAAREPPRRQATQQLQPPSRTGSVTADSVRGARLPPATPPASLPDSRGQSMVQLPAPGRSALLASQLLQLARSSRHAAPSRQPSAIMAKAGRAAIDQASGNAAEMSYYSYVMGGTVRLRFLQITSPGKRNGMFMLTWQHFQPREDALRRRRSQMRHLPVEASLPRAVGGGGGGGVGSHSDSSTVGARDRDPYGGPTSPVTAAFPTLYE